MRLELKQVSVTYGDTVVVKTVTATVEPGQFIALVGPNGSGKSSLLKAIAGLIPSAGQTNLPKDRTSRAKGLAYLAQDATAPDRRLVKDIIALGRTPHVGALSKYTENDRSIISDSIEKCGISDFTERPFGSLSGGEKMRVHLARTLATQAPLLLADEPVTALDPYYQLSVMDVLKDYAAKGRTVITALHDLSLARTYADRIWVMKDGELFKDDSPAQALDTETLAHVFRITPNGTRV